MKKPLASKHLSLRVSPSKFWKTNATMPSLEVVITIRACPIVIVV